MKIGQEGGTPMSRNPHANDEVVLFKQGEKILIENRVGQRPRNVLKRWIAAGVVLPLQVPKSVQI